MNTIRYFIYVMKAPKTIYGGFSGKLKFFRRACKIRKATRKSGGVR